MLNEKDKNVLLTTQDIDLSSSKYAYLGGVFGSNEEDYVEILIHDANQNLLETNIVDSSDYTYDENVGVKLKTGTILRKLGYDRGRYVVKYNFLRRKAGSHETVLINNDNEIFTDEFNPETDIDMLGNQLSLKENKYLVHEISPSRNEIRLMPQRIKNDKYLRDFFNLGRKRKTYISDIQNGNTAIEFKGQSGQKENSVEIGFQNEDMKFSKDMIGGTLIIKNAFVRAYEYIEGPPSSIGVSQIEIIDPDVPFEQARFIAEPENTLYKNNASGYPGDTNQIRAFAAFKGDDGKGFADGSFPGTTQQLKERMNTSDATVRYKGGHQMENIYDVDDTDFQVIQFVNPIDDGFRNDADERYVEATVFSTSTLKTDGATNYRWELTGFDVDGNLKADNADPITVRPIGAISGGDVQIQQVANTDAQVFAVPNTLTPKIAEVVVQAESQRSGAPRPKVAMRFRIFSSKCRVGVKLTVTTSNSNVPSMIHLPCMFETKG